MVDPVTTILSVNVFAPPIACVPAVLTTVLSTVKLPVEVIVPPLNPSPVATLVTVPKLVV